MTKNTKGIVGAIAGFVAVLVLAYFAGKAIPTRPKLIYDGWANVSLTMLACTTLEKTDSMNAILKSGDQEAWKRGAAVAITLGDCDLLNPGDVVNVTERSGYMVKVRKRGEVTAYWINPAALTR